MALQGQISLTRFRRVSQSLAALAVATGIAALVGWWRDIVFLKSVLPGLVPMAPMTAVGFILAGLSLFLLQKEGQSFFPKDWWGRLGQAFALLLTLIGLLTLGRYLGASDLGTDQLLFPDATTTAITNRMAPQTAVAFVLLGMALLLLDVRTTKGAWPSQLLAGLAASIGFASLLGYAYGVPLYRMGSLTPIALHTGALMMVLNAGILLARPQRGVVRLLSRPGPGGELARRLLPAAVAVPFVLGWLRLLGQRAGLYDTGIGTATYALAMILILTGLIYWSAGALDRLAEQRQEAEDELKRFFSISMDLLCIAGTDGFFKVLNPRWEKILGYSQQELLSQPYLEFIREEDREATLQEAAKLAQGHDLVSFENRYRCRDGGFRWFNWTATAATERGLIYAAARDVTQRKQIELEQARHAAIIASSLDAVISKTLDGAITSWNPAAEKMFGYSAQEAVGQGMLMLIPPELAEEEARILDRIRHGEQVEHFETVRRNKNGEPIEVSVTISPIKDGSGQIIGASKIVRDITERRQSERRIQELNRELGHKLEELAAVNKELEGFSYSVAHDLRAPLRHVDGFSKILLEDHGPEMKEEARRLLERVRDGAQRMGTLIDELLNFSRLGRREPQRQITGLNSLVEEAWGGLRAEGDGRAIEWRAGRLSYADCDPALMKQVFANLLSNALKFTRPREQAVIEVGQFASQGQTVVFVRDNGVGFDMKYADKLFGVFQRLHRSEEFEGTGVGLALVQKIILKHGGRIWVEAALDRGATFYFTLGAGEAAAQPAGAETGGAYGKSR